jgi:NAD(P)-dependent dehydrogenase (short-subunit alcohol dehydrogenase family)
MRSKADRFKNKVAIVTGGGMGLGKALCQALGCEGAAVIVADIDGHAAQQVAERLTLGMMEARSAQIDVSKQEDIVGLIARTAAEFGRLDYLFNNAAIAIGGDARDLSAEHWERVLAVDLLGVVHGALAAYRVMAKQGHGHIVNISSLGGLVPQPGNLPYSTAKWGLIGFSLGLKAEASGLGVKVSCVCPGDMKTEIYKNMTVVNLDRETVIRLSRRSHFLMPQWSVERAADEILRGVIRNKAMIIFPAIVRWIWRLNRASPGLIGWVSLRRVRMIRKALSS